MSEQAGLGFAYAPGCETTKRGMVHRAAHGCVIICSSRPAAAAGWPESCTPNPCVIARAGAAMGLVDVIRLMWNPADAVTSLIMRWDPAGCGTEIECRASLQRFLERELRPLHVRETLSEGVPSELVVQKSVAVAIHGKLDTSADYYRLIGRLAAYQDWNGAMLVVVTGRVVPELRRRVEEYVRSGHGPRAVSFRLLQK